MCPVAAGLKSVCSDDELRWCKCWCRAGSRNGVEVTDLAFTPCPSPAVWHYVNRPVGGHLKINDQMKMNLLHLSVNLSGGTEEAWCGGADPVGGTKLPFTRLLSSSPQPLQQWLPWWSAKTSGTWPLGGSGWLSASVFLYLGHIHFETHSSPPIELELQ